jgi:hypothetical protein
MTIAALVAITVALLRVAHDARLYCWMNSFFQDVFADRTVSAQKKQTESEPARSNAILRFHDDNG